MVAAGAPVRTAPDDLLEPAVQASLLRRVVAYDPGLSGGEAVRVLVVHGRLSAPRAAELALALTAAGFVASALEVDEAERVASARVVVWVMPDAASDAVKRLTTTRSWLSVCGEGATTLSGGAALALRRREDGRPEILLHLGRLKAEKHAFLSSLVEMAKVIR